MSYWWVEHAAEVQMEIEAPTEEAVFTDACVRRAVAGE